MNTQTVPTLSGRIPGTFAILFGSLVLSATPAFADNTTKFEAADSDSSGSLDLAEFRSMLPGKTPKKQVLKRFNRADGDNDQEVTLAEWLAYKDDLEDQKQIREKRTDRFNRADLDDNGFLNYDEFIPTVAGKRPLIEVRRRFIMADADEDLLVSLSEWLDYKKGKTGDDPKKLGKFALADLDDNGELTPDELMTVFPRKTPEKIILRKFDRMDRNDDGVLTRNEWRKGKDKIKPEPT